MSFKVLYFVGESITDSTRMKKGLLHTKSFPYVITSDDEEISLNHIIMAEKAKIPGGGSIIKLTEDSFVVFLLVPRLYIDKGNGFVVVNKGKTNQLYQLLNQSD